MAAPCPSRGRRNTVPGSAPSSILLRFSRPSCSCLPLYLFLTVAAVYDRRISLIPDPRRSWTAATVPHHHWPVGRRHLPKVPRSPDLRLRTLNMESEEV